MKKILANKANRVDGKSTSAREGCQIRKNIEYAIQG